MSEEAYKEELLTEVLKEFRVRFRHMDEVCRLTKELADGLSRDDRVSAKMVLDMRGKELEAVNECTRHIEVFQSSMQEEEGQRLGALLKGEAKPDGYEYIGVWKEIRDIAEQTRAVWKRTMEIDRVMSRRMAGKDSFYK